MNPFYKPQQNMQMPGPFQNISNMMQQFNQFKQNFQGNPQQRVQELLNSGQMTQEQFNQLSNLAKQFQSFMR